MPRALTPRTRLDTIRKEAKRWLKALRAGDAKARARLDAAWRGAPAAPGLRDVQHAVALEYGSESWTALKAAIAELAPALQSRPERIERLLRHGWDGDINAARRILARHPELAADSLFTAVSCGALEEVERRLAREPDAARRAGGPMNWTALAYTTYGRLDPANAVAIAGRLLRAGADPNFRFDDGWGCPFTVLTGAIGLGEGGKPSHAQAPELVELLVAAGAAPYDLQALYNVSLGPDETGWYDRFWQLCERGGELDKWRIAGEGRLGNHVGKNSLDYLLGNAVGQNQPRRAAWLLERGADPNTTHHQTGSPVHALAQLSGFGELAALLEAHGAAPVPLTGIDALIAAAMRQDEGALRGMLAEAPELLHSPLPLLAAAVHGDAAATALLLSLGADPHAVDGDGITPLHRAVQSGSLAVVDRLLEAGGEVDRRERKWGGTPLSWAGVLKQPHVAERLAPLSRDVRTLAWLGRAEPLRALLARDPRCADERGEGDDAPPPLFCLPDDDPGAVEIAEVLLAHGADPRTRNRHGRTPAEAARARGLDDAADLME
ncbi:MAG TPA: ankyrin repeat domain-containing protein [Allosphingosinicella sp.]|jgi:ankyrin repeat protein|nr:ankyrin repeat domain-containing protein [Allosphingosinicella sp.]